MLHFADTRTRTQGRSRMKMCLIVDPRGSLRASGTGRKRSLPRASELPAGPLDETFHEAGDGPLHRQRRHAVLVDRRKLGEPSNRLPAVWFARDPGCRASYGRLDLKT